MSVRDSLVEAVTTAAGPKVNVIPYQDNLDNLDRVTVMFKQGSIEALVEAPRSAYKVNYVLTVVSPATDPKVAEAELDDVVIQLLGDLDDLDWFAWSSADKVLFQSSNLAYDIHCWNISRKV